MKELQRNDVYRWMEKGPIPEILPQLEEFGNQIKNGGLTTSQIRQVFSKMKAIEAKGFEGQRAAFLMIKPLMAYAAARHQKAKGLQSLKTKASWGIDAVFAGGEAEEAGRFKNFCKFFEAILAYHRAAGGK
ncbi:MAG: type III-A CRISPR-associated protein Csm2 [Desulfosarcina sp.]|nr:type III-A CRISPR-associated protein Csm2 [Desulfosarcina sp.]MBC2744362.1 type III-A CRISPR-associated protein Csm2 [Desulfosarcina sp.]MBC2767271.1 type III-A CRISPR-associated protein Csm2 [Desulfosarcina sp.]